MATPTLMINGNPVPISVATKPGRAARAIKNLLKPVVTAEEAWQLLEEKFASRFRSVREAFVKFDMECDGVISDKEMRFALAALGLEMTNGEYKKLWRKFDTTGDGSISYAEFNNKVGHLIHPQGMMVLNRPETPKIKEWQKKAIARGLRKKVANLDDAFKEVDKDGSGRVSHPEFIQLLRSLGLAKIGHEESWQMMQRARKPGNDTMEMTQEEFKDAMMEYMKIPEDALRGDDDDFGPKPDSLVAAEKILQDKLFNKFGAVQKAFRQFDEDKSGELTYDEFRKALKGMNIALTDDQFYALVAKFDTSRDGSITYEEFNNYIGPLIHPDAKDNSRSMKDVEKYGGMQAGFVYDVNARNSVDYRNRGFESDGKIGEHVDEAVMFKGDTASASGESGDGGPGIGGYREESKEEDPAPGSSAAPSPVHAGGSAAGAGGAAAAMRRASMGVASAGGRRDSGAGAAATARRISGVGLPPVGPSNASAASSGGSMRMAAPQPMRTHRAGSVATAELDLGATEDKMRRVLGRSWVQVFSDVKRAASAAGAGGGSMALGADQFRDVMAEKGVPLTSKEVRALQLRYSAGGAGGQGQVDAERLLRTTFSKAPLARPATAAARTSMGGAAATMSGTARMGTTRPPAGPAATMTRPASAFVRAPAGGASPAKGGAGPALHSTGKMIF